MANLKWHCTPSGAGEHGETWMHCMIIHGVFLSNMSVHAVWKEKVACLFTWDITDITLGVAQNINWVQESMPHSHSNHLLWLHFWGNQGSKVASKAMSSFIGQAWDHMFCFLFVRVCDLLQQPNEMSSNIPVIDTNLFSCNLLQSMSLFIWSCTVKADRKCGERERGHATNVHGWIQTSDFVIMKNEFQATRPLRCCIRMY